MSGEGGHVEHRRKGRKPLTHGLLTARQRLRLALVLVAAATMLAAQGRAAQAPLMRVELHLAPGAHSSPHMLLLTLGGPIYCQQLENLAHNENASLACTDYGPNRYEGAGGRAGRLEDWGDPRYLAQVAKLPATLRAEGVKISKLVLVGVSYSGFANAELVALHPEIHADALVVVDSYLDLAARFDALPLHHETRAEMETVLGGTPATKPAAYRSRSPSHHLLGLAEAIHHGTHLVVVWSTSSAERHEFHGATCSRLANALWLAQLAKILDHPVTGYVTQMRHAHALWDRGEGLLALAGVATTSRPLHAKSVTFGAGAAPPPGSYC